MQPRPKLGRWTAELDAFLEGKAKPAREQLTLIRIYEERRGRGYEGSYAGRCAKQHGRAMAVAYVPLSFAPGEAYQFDWSREIVLLRRLSIAARCLSPSYARSARRPKLLASWSIGAAE